MTQAVECPLDRNLPPHPYAWRRWAISFGYFVTFCILGSLCLLWALGYKVNWTAGTIEQTGIIQLSSPQAGFHPDVFVNGVKQSESLPLTLRWLFPGHYDVLVQQDGYQSWEKQITVDPNQRVNYPGILLLYLIPQSVTPPNVRIDQIVSRQYNNSDIEIRSENELWLKGQFITRSSYNILNPEYFFDADHVIYQVGNKLVVRDLVSSTSQDVVTFNSSAPVPYLTQDNGRTVVYVEEEVLKAVSLYQATSIIDRLGVNR